MEICGLFEQPARGHIYISNGRCMGYWIQMCLYNYYEVSAQKPSQLVLDGATELIYNNWRQSIPQPGEPFEV